MTITDEQLREITESYDGASALLTHLAADPRFAKLCSEVEQMAFDARMAAYTLKDGKRLSQGDDHTLLMLVESMSHAGLAMGELARLKLQQMPAKDGGPIVTLGTDESPEDHAFAVEDGPDLIVRERLFQALGLCETMVTLAMLILEKEVRFLQEIKRRGVEPPKVRKRGTH